MGDKKYIIFGAGTFMSDVFDLIHRNNGRVYKIYQNVPEKLHELDMPLPERIAALGYDVEVFDSLDPFEPEADCRYVVGTISVHKYALIEELKTKFNLTFDVLIDPSVHISSNVTIGEGVIINPGCVIAPNVTLDDFCVINRSASIGHEVKIGKYSRIGPCTAIASATIVGDKCGLGIRTTVFDRVRIGDWTTVGAGSLVNKDIPERVIAYGSPAKVIRSIDES